MSKFYVTTPIYYINDQPHIGHTYSTIAADVLARYHRQLGDDVLFSAGVDENAQKTVEAAAAAGKPNQAYADDMSKLWRGTWEQLDISFDKFVRTSQADHKKAVYAVLKPVVAKGDIYKGEYQGLYCVGCEEFKKESDLVDGKCPLHNRVPEQLKEENYFFKLSAYSKQLLTHIKAHPEFVQPIGRRNEVIAFIERGLEDISVSRATQKWGIPWPDDDKQVFYVWFDALICYLTAAGYPGKGYEAMWPPDLQIVGKDIIKFHCIIWPAMLLSAGLPLPKQVFAHGFFTIDGTKISKSLGNAIDPLKLTKDYGIDALRYYLLSEIPFGGDGDFSMERFVTVYNTELANDLGNLVQRSLTMISKYQGGTLGAIPTNVHDEKAYTEALNELKFDRALGEVWELVRGTNQLIDAEKPWELAKSDPKQLEWVLGQVVADLRQIGQLLLPFLPHTAASIIKAFTGPQIDTSAGILFPRVEFTKTDVG